MRPWRPDFEGEVVAINSKNYCSELCLEANEPLAGTALHVDVWIMLEYRRAWQANALESNTLLDATNEWLKQTVLSFAAQGLVARPQFMRRPQKSAAMQLIVSRGDKLTGIALEREQDLHGLDVLRTELPDIAGPQYFVCTNAKRDLCCAKFGRPTFAALHRAIPDRVWQTTHVGGHRYAPNVLALPVAALYGRVMAEDVPRFLQSTERKQLAHEFLRGRTAYSKIAQVAEHTLARQLSTAEVGEQLPADLKLLRESEQTATFATPNGVREVVVQKSDTPLRVLASCGKPAELIYPLIGRLSES